MFLVAYCEHSKSLLSVSWRSFFWGDGVVIMAFALGMSLVIGGMGALGSSRQLLTPLFTTVHVHLLLLCILSFYQPHGLLPSFCLHLSYFSSSHLSFILHPWLAWPSISPWPILHFPWPSTYHMWETFPDLLRSILNITSFAFPQWSLHTSVILLPHGSITHSGVCCPRPEAPYPLRYTKELL